MRLTSKLFGYLYRSFRLGPNSYSPFKIRYDGAMKWRVIDSVFKTAVSGGSGRNLSIDLSPLTMAQFRAVVAAQAGYTVPEYDTQYDDLGALGLLDSNGSQDPGVPVALTAYASLEWGFLDSAASVLHAARESIIRMPLEMSIPTASGFWLDYLGGYYSVDRVEGETDTHYATRILYTILQPKNNNISIEEAIYHAMGKQHPVRVVDAPITVLYKYHTRSGEILFDGRQHHGPEVVRYFCQFDVVTPIDIVNEPSISAALNRITHIANQTRSAGTRLREIRTTSAIKDQCIRQLDRCNVVAGFDLADTPYRHLHDGTLARDGSDVWGHYEELLDVEADVAIREKGIAPFLYGDAVTRDGSQRRGGLRTSAVDLSAIRMSVNTRRNGHWPRDGTLRYAANVTINEAI